MILYVYNTDQKSSELVTRNVTRIIVTINMIPPMKSCNIWAHCSHTVNKSNNMLFCDCVQRYADGRGSKTYANIIYLNVDPTSATLAGFVVRQQQQQQQPRFSSNYLFTRATRTHLPHLECGIIHIESLCSLVRLARRLRTGRDERGLIV